MNIVETIYYEEESAEYEIEEEEQYAEDEDLENTENVPKLTYNCSSYYDNTWAAVAGWGATYKSESSCILRAARTRIYPNSDPQCLDEEESVLSDDKICAYNPDWDTDASCQAEDSTQSIQFIIGLIHMNILQQTAGQRWVLKQ